MRRIAAVVQARCASGRLHAKVLVPLAGKPVIEHVLSAVGAATLIDDVVLATTCSPVDDPLVAIASRLGVRVFRGSESNVLERFVGAIESHPADVDVVVRHTADDPLLDPAVIDTVVGHYLRGGCDYASNMIARSWPRGLDTEVLSREALMRSYRDATRPEDHEHVTFYVRTHPELFRLRNVTALPQETWPDLRLCIDTVEDQMLLEKVFDALYAPGKIIRVGTVIDWLKEHPEVVSLNARICQKATLGRVY
jgi:spore coat polysaccharide biosynthesis protein SpsF